MNHVDTLRAILNSVSPGEPVFTLRLSGPANIRTVESPWSANVSGNSFHELLVKNYARRTLALDHSNKKVYTIDVNNSISSIKESIGPQVMDIFMKVCPNTNPRRTKLFKDVQNMIRRLHTKDDNHPLLNFAFDIVQYYDSVTKEFSIKDRQNDVHRKNMYQLFNIMEQKHGSKENGNK